MPRGDSPRNPAEQMLQRRPRGQGRQGLFSFFGEVIGELKKVTWPTREETTRLTILVISVSVAIGIILGVIDLGFSRLFDRII